MINHRDDFGQPKQSEEPRLSEDNFTDQETKPALNRVKNSTGSMWRAAMSLLSSWYGAGDNHSNTPHIDL